MKTKFDIWKEYWDELDCPEKISIRNNYCSESNNEDELFCFDEEFFEMFFSGTSAIEVARAVFFGDIKSWNDDYIKFNGYGNLESMSSYDAVEDTEKYYLDEIYSHERSWSDYIDCDDVNDDFRGLCLEEVKKMVLAKRPNLDPENIEEEFDNGWDDDDENPDLALMSVSIIQYFDEDEKDGAEDMG